MAKSREVIDHLAVADVPYYGVSTGFGALATRHIAPSLACPAPTEPDP